MPSEEGGVWFGSRLFVLLPAGFICSGVLACFFLFLRGDCLRLGTVSFLFLFGVFVFSQDDAVLMVSCCSMAFSSRECSLRKVSVAMVKLAVVNSIIVAIPIVRAVCGCVRAIACYEGQGFLRVF